MVYSTKSNLIKLIQRFSRWLAWGSSVAVVSMMLLSCTDVSLRYFGYPIKGTYEIVGLLGALVIGLGIAYTQVQQGHIAVELVFSRLPERIQRIVNIITWFPSMFVFILLAWQSTALAVKYSRTGLVSETLRLPIYPIVYGVAFASAIMCLVLLADLLSLLTKGPKK